MCAQHPLAADMLIQPGIIHDAVVCSCEAAMEFITADPAPRGKMIGSAAVKAGAGNVKQLREGPPHPWPGIILVRDGIDAETGYEGLQLLGRPGVLNLPEGLGKHIGPTPDQNP
ncbi:hypothetical protein D3C75_693570 [compost metagenome]